MKIKFLLLVYIYISDYYLYKQYCLNGLKISCNFYCHSLLKVEERSRYKFSFFKFQLSHPSFPVHSLNPLWKFTIRFHWLDTRSRAKVGIGKCWNFYTFLYIRVKNRERIRFLCSFCRPVGIEMETAFRGLDPRYDYAPLPPPRPGRVT